MKSSHHTEKTHNVSLLLCGFSDLLCYWVCPFIHPSPFLNPSIPLGLHFLYPSSSTPFFCFCTMATNSTLDPDLPTCRELHCSSHGTCVPPVGAGVDVVCECDLGYQGQSCDDTVHGSLSLPLTLGVLGVIIGLLILAFILAKCRQRQKKNRR